MPLTQKQLEELRNVLMQRRNDLLSKASETRGGRIAQSRELQDTADLAGNEAQRNFVLRVRDRERKLILKIDRTLEKMNEGSYGICEECEEDIGIQRLRARPVASLCIACKTVQEEREALMK